MTEIVTTEIVGSSTNTTWSQAQTYHLGERTLMVVLQLRLQAEETLLDVATLGSQILGDIERQAPQVKDNTNLGEMIKASVSGLPAELTIGLIVGLVTGRQLSLQGTGEVEALLARDGGLARLRGSWQGGGSIEGELKIGDKLLLSTGQLIQGLGVESIREILLKDDSPGELLSPLVHKQADSSATAGVVGVWGRREGKPVWSGWTLHYSAPRKMNLWIGAVIFGLLVLMIGVGVVRKGQVESTRAITNLETSVRGELQKITQDTSMSAEGVRQGLERSRDEVRQYLATNPKANLKVRAESLLSAIQVTEDGAFKKNEISLTTVTDLDVLLEGLEAQHMESNGRGDLLFLDSSASKAVALHLLDRSRRVIELPKDQDWVGVVAGEESLYALSKQGVSKLSFESSKVTKVIEPDDFWQTPTELGLFGGNVYILDTGQSEIWKYPTLGETFGGRRRWLAPGITPDFSKVVDMKVTGDIWLLTSTGKIARYRRGAPVDFVVKGYPAEGGDQLLKDPGAIWVSESLIYVLERGGARVVVFDEEGSYRAQYASPEFARASDLVIVDDKGYVLVDNAVKEFGL